MTAPRGTPPSAASVMLAVTDETAPAVAAAVLAGSSVDPRVAALCRWVLVADVAKLRRELVGARAEATLAREDFHRLRALRADHVPRSLEPDTIDDDLSDAIPISLDDENDDEEVTSVARAGRATVRIAPRLPRQSSADS